MTDFAWGNENEKEEAVSMSEDTRNIVEAIYVCAGFFMFVVIAAFAVLGVTVDLLWLVAAVLPAALGALLISYSIVVRPKKGEK